MLILLATLIFFTRLPFWRLIDVPAEDFKRVVPRWPLVGWLTGGMMALTLWLSSNIFPLTVAWILALLVRIVLTGCLHEDGLADFIDGFGGGTSREKTLAIMKDSHIGTYGVIGLIVYAGLMLTMPSTISRDMLCILLVCCDCWAKCCAAQLINFLPYARSEEEAKNKTVYARMTLPELLLCFFGGLAPSFICVFALGWLPRQFLLLMIVPVLVLLLLRLVMKRKIQGYTGDCCGATFLLCELSLYLAVLAAYPYWF
ncbi:MAG: adenosylcobinamide-GDP ribazoletransferase [Bacteroidales bacterium]|nr:adenosylcobinamide-GDP ribazoletransferase [Bacteroidales bacterium]